MRKCSARWDRYWSPAAGDSVTYSPLANLIGRTVEGGRDLYLDTCVAEPESEYLLLSELGRLSGYAAPPLSWLVRKGWLAAVKRGGRWYSTVAAVVCYRTVADQRVTLGSWAASRLRQRGCRAGARW